MSFSRFLAFFLISKSDDDDKGKSEGDKKLESTKFVILTYHPMFPPSLTNN